MSKAEARQERREKRKRNNESLKQRVMESEERQTRKNRAEKEKAVNPKTEAQRRYLNAIDVYDMVFGIGPAGTGKTWLAAYMAAEAFQNGYIDKIIITRPALESSEEGLGFLPGVLEEKYEPYLRPVRDAFDDHFGPGQTNYLIEAKTIDVRPLNFIRGSTLKNCWLIADEMQNATKREMLTLLSRIGENAKFLINGDPSQCDLRDPRTSGLLDAYRRLSHLKEVGAVRFEMDDVVRSGLCRAVLEAYRDEDSSSECYSDVDSDTAGLHRMLQVS